MTTRKSQASKRDSRGGRSLGSAAAEIARWESGRARVASDWLAREEPLEIRVRGRSIAITMRTPGHDDELAAGFLLTEGLIRRTEDIVQIAACTTGEAALHGNVLNVFLAPRVRVNFKQLTRHVFASSSCGLCGKASIDAVQQQFPAVAPGFTIAATTLQKLPDRLRAAQKTFAQTGGLHAAAVFDRRGKLLVIREDVGRHNAVDKVLGWALLNGHLPLDQHVLLVSGRASFEILQKALAARVPVIAAISAPSSLAAEFAQASGQTLVGFLRGETMNVYAGRERVR
jgi:FdhD protein